MDSRKLDDIINRLLECQGRPSELNLSDLEIRLLCRESGQIFLQQPNLLELEAPINICGDIRSQYSDLLRLFEIAGLPDQTKYLFLGDYVDDGKQSLETICLLLAFKMKYPCKIFLLRGDHECASVNHNYGFYKRMNDEMWEAFIHCFDCMPVAALIDKRILCMHGGLSPKLHDLNQIRNLERPTHVPDSGLLHDIIYSCPSKDDIGWAASERNGVVLYTFGPGKVKEFLHEHDLVLICCAHEVVENGYECFADANLVAIFSAPNYRGEYGNDGAVVRVDKNLEWRFEILTPPGKGREFNHGSGSTAKLERPLRCTKMEEIRQVALAYYNNLSDKQRERAQEFFDSLDADRDGTVSPEELLDYFLREEKVDRIVALGLFGKLDRNRDGALDFEECTMLYYLTRVRRWVTCNGCGSHLDGIRFTCVPCFESNVNGKGYNLCAICYRYKNYTHRHSNFLDNYLLLEVKRLEQIRPNQHQGSTSNAFKVYHHNNPNMGNTSNAIDVYRPNIPNRTKTELTLKAFEVLCQIGTLATSVANIATTNCSIM